MRTGKTAVCCVCGCKAKGMIVYDEFVCFSCHKEATGETPPKQSANLRRKKPRLNRIERRDFLIIENLKNKVEER